MMGEKEAAKWRTGAGENVDTWDHGQREIDSGAFLDKKKFGKVFNVLFNAFQLPASSFPIWKWREPMYSDGHGGGEGMDPIENIS